MWPVLLAFIVVDGLASRVAATTADDLCAPTANPCRVTTRINNVTDQSVIDVGARELRIENGGTLATVLGAAAAGSMTIRAGRLTVMGNGALLVEGTAARNGGDITIEAGEVTVDGRISATGGSGGGVTINGTARVTIAGTIEASRFANEGEGGAILVRGGTINLNGNITALGGLSGFGGDITVQSTGDLNVTGDIAAEGGDGGSVELAAGAGTGAGNVMIARTSTIDTDARSPGSFGGAIDIEARGDGTNTGTITMNGTLFCNGGTGTEEEGGGDGGDISLTAVGFIRITERGSTMEVQGGRPDGFGGTLEISTAQGNFESIGRMVVGPLSEEGGGGDVTIDILGDLTLDGPLEGSGGSEVLIEADGSVAIENDGNIDVSGGGSLCLEAGQGAEDLLGRIVVRAPLTANGGTIELVARDSLTLTAPVRADGPSGGGPGGTVQITVDEGPAVLNDLVSARATGGASVGGTLSVDAQGRVSVVGTLDAMGAGATGGTVGITSVAESVDISGAIRAGSTGTGAGGMVEIISAAELTISGTVRADGGSPNGSAGGLIELNACNINVNEVAQLSVLRPNGINRVIGRRETLVLGRMIADNQTGLNEFRFRAPQNEPVIFGTVQPRQTLVMDASITPCVECGNGVTEPPEECDDDNLNDGDGCSRTCTIEEILAGDVNGDLEVDDADLTALAAEIFDGDGDSVADVGSPEGSFPGGPGADANENERVEAADATAIIRILSPAP
jgi:cysteine-rich repeat protein